MDRDGHRSAEEPADDGELLGDVAGHVRRVTCQPTRRESEADAGVETETKRSPEIDFATNPVDSEVEVT